MGAEKGELGRGCPPFSVSALREVSSRLGQESGSQIECRGKERRKLLFLPPQWETWVHHSFESNTGFRLREAKETRAVFQLEQSDLKAAGLHGS
jgi:hypothetical protein